MLRKLYKHEFIALYRVLLPLYAVLVGMSVLTRLTGYIDSEGSMILEAVKRLTMVLTVLVIVGTFFAGFVLLVVRFYQNLLTKQGYLTNTLPFKTHHHLLCKMLCGVVVEVSNTVMTLFSLLIIFGTKERWQGFCDFIQNAFGVLADDSSTANAYACMIELGVILLASAAVSLLLMYACMAIGQQFKNKILGSVIAYFCIYAANQALSTMLMLGAMLCGFLTDEEIFANASVTGVSQGVLLFTFVILAVQGAAYYWISHHFLSKKLNLE